MDWYREIKVPNFLHELHGEKTTPISLFMVYLGATIVALFVTLVMVGTGLETWRLLVLFIVFFDIGGGVVANFTHSTVQHYREGLKKRMMFLLMHFLHIALLLVILPSAVDFILFVGIYTITSAFILDGLRPGWEMKAAAALFVIPGLLASLLLPVPHVILYSFAPLFMVKLLLGFVGQREYD